jgi:hypothetical protein
VLKEYLNYCEIPNFNTANILAQAIAGSDLNYSIHNELLEIWKRYSNPLFPNFILKTSGSTQGVPRSYSFGPLPDFWINCFEKLTKFPNHNKTILIQNISLTNNTSTALHFFDAHENEPNYSAYLNVPYFNNLTTSQFCSKIAEQENVILSADPPVWLYLNNHPTFVEFITKRKDISLLSTNWEPFYKRLHGVYINDTMINWHNGFNFYTCIHGNKHSYPIFAIDGNNFINLLNLTGFIGSFDDQFSLGGLCNCGKICITDVIPHTEVQIKFNNKYLFSLELAEQLDSCYENLQFIQADGLIHVCYIGIMSNHDRDIIDAFLFNHVRKLRTYQKNTMLKINTKLPTFYKNIHKIPFIQRKNSFASAHLLL